MTQFLILRLQGVLQAWGKHTYEDYRPSEVFPTHSGLIGLLAACLGIERTQAEQLEQLGRSFIYAVRLDKRSVSMRKLTDFHTILAARKVDGSKNSNPVVSHREYLCDAQFTVAIQLTSEASWTLEKWKDALQRPVFTPFLGRRSCPITAPLYDNLLEAEDLVAALKQVAPHDGVIYSAWKGDSFNRLVVRDVPRYHQHRQFDTRSVYIHASEDENVFQSV